MEVLFWKMLLKKTKTKTETVGTPRKLRSLLFYCLYTAPPCAPLHAVLIIGVETIQDGVPVTSSSIWTIHSVPPTRSCIKILRHLKDLCLSHFPCHVLTLLLLFLFFAFIFYYSITSHPQPQYCLLISQPLLFLNIPEPSLTPSFPTLVTEPIFIRLTLHCVLLHAPSTVFNTILQVFRSNHTVCGSTCSCTSTPPFLLVS
jgi:hypothetical protein